MTLHCFGMKAGFFYGEIPVLRKGRRSTCAVIRCIAPLAIWPRKKEFLWSSLLALGRRGAISSKSEPNARQVKVGIG